jgi:hypothetical protein
LLNPQYVIEREHVLSKSQEAKVDAGLDVIIIQKLLIKVFAASWQKYALFHSLINKY